MHFHGIFVTGKITGMHFNRWWCSIFLKYECIIFDQRDTNNQNPQIQTWKSLRWSLMYISDRRVTFAIFWKHSLVFLHQLRWIVWIKLCPNLMKVDFKTRYLFNLRFCKSADGFWELSFRTTRRSVVRLPSFVLIYCILTETFSWLSSLCPRRCTPNLAATMN